VTAIVTGTIALAIRLSNILFFSRLL